MEKVQQDPEELVARYLQSPRPELKDLIMVQFAGTVERIARKYSGLEPYQDLVQVGFIGLLNALKKFDPTSGVRFTTYASHLITGEIKHYLRDRSQTIRQPAWLQELRHKVSRTTGMLQQTTGKPPTAEQIAKELGVSESSVQEVLSTQEMLRVSSLDTQSMLDDEGGEAERIDVCEPCSQQVSLEERVVLEKAMGQLRDLERQVLIHFYFDSMIQSEIAKKVGISPNYVSHILRQAQAKLRAILENEEAQDELLRQDVPELDLVVVDRATGAYTEAFLRNRLQEEIHRSASGDGDVALLIVQFVGVANLERFYGREATNAFITDASEFLRSNVRRLNVVCRFGDDSFALILPYAGPNVSVVRERIGMKASQWVAGRTAGSVSTRMGDSWSPKHGKTVNELIAVAQEAAAAPSLV